MGRKCSCSGSEDGTETSRYHLMIGVMSFWAEDEASEDVVLGTYTGFGKQ